MSDRPRIAGPEQRKVPAADHGRIWDRMADGDESTAATIAAEYGVTPTLIRQIAAGAIRYRKERRP